MKRIYQLSGVFLVCVLIILFMSQDGTGLINEVETTAESENIKTDISPTVSVQNTEEISELNGDNREQTNGLKSFNEDESITNNSFNIPMVYTFPDSENEIITIWRPPLSDFPMSYSPFEHFYFARPIPADHVNWPLADYRYGGTFFGLDIVHTGIDIPVATGTPVLAAGSGKVIWAGYGYFSGTWDTEDPYGISVAIKHDFGYQGQRMYSVYAHLDKTLVEVGELVQTGDLIAESGNTGNTTGPHLHFEIRLGNNSFYASRNPELWIVPPQGTGILVGKLFNTNGSILEQQVVEIENLSSGRIWKVISYRNMTIIPDPYYDENLVISDLPTGDYRISTEYLEETYLFYTKIEECSISYFEFNGEYGFKEAVPSDIRN